MRPPFFLTFLFWKRRKHNPVLCENMRSNFTKKEQVPILRFCVPKILVFFWRASSCAGLFPAFSTLLPLSFFWMCPFVRFAVFIWQKECGWRSACVVTIAGRTWERNLIPPFACSCTKTGVRPWIVSRQWSLVLPASSLMYSFSNEENINLLLMTTLYNCRSPLPRSTVFAFKSSHVLMYTNVVLQIRFSLSLTDFIYLLYNVAFFCDIFLCSPY